MKEQPAMISIKGLRERGWSPAMIKHFLVKPDQYKVNPVYKNQQPMRLWMLARVLSAEALPEFAKAKILAATRSKRGKAVAQAKAAELVAQAEQLPITVKRLSPGALLDKAIKSYNYRKLEKAYVGYDVPNDARRGDNPEFLARLQVNFLRHEGTVYDHQIESFARRVGVDAADEVIRRRVYAAIAAAYPVLAGECERQWKARMVIKEP